MQTDINYVWGTEGFMVWPSPKAPTFGLMPCSSSLGGRWTAITDNPTEVAQLMDHASHAANGEIPLHRFGMWIPGWPAEWDRATWRLLFRLGAQPPWVRRRKWNSEIDELERRTNGNGHSNGNGNGITIRERSELHG